MVDKTKGAQSCLKQGYRVDSNSSPRIQISTQLNVTINVSCCFGGTPNCPLFVANTCIVYQTEENHKTFIYLHRHAATLQQRSTRRLKILPSFPTEEKPETRCCSYCNAPLNLLPIPHRRHPCHLRHLLDRPSAKLLFLRA